MLTFPLVLTAGIVKINNVGSEAKPLQVYVPNKDSYVISVPAGAAIDIVTQSAGESLTYLAQADKDLTVVMAQ